MREVAPFPEFWSDRGQPGSNSSFGHIFQFNGGGKMQPQIPTTADLLRMTFQWVYGLRQMGSEVNLSILRAG
jgi:hypothetical protein